MRNERTVTFAEGRRRRMSSRLAASVAVMTALCTASRLVPYFKPVSALIILTGMWLGPAAGLMTGALTALLSDFWFGVGPWLPFQMAAWGTVGLAAGLMSPVLKKHRAAALLFGIAAGAAFSLIMDIFTVLWAYGRFTPALYRAALVSAVPHTLNYAVSNFVYLVILGKPLGEKLKRLSDRIGGPGETVISDRATR